MGRHTEPMAQNRISTPRGIESDLELWIVWPIFAEQSKPNSMYNHFLEFSLDELVEAYAYFTDMRDNGGCQLVADAFDQKTSLTFINSLS